MMVVAEAMTVFFGSHGGSCLVIVVVSEVIVVVSEAMVVVPVSKAILWFLKS